MVLTLEPPLLQLFRPGRRILLEILGSGVPLELVKFSSSNDIFWLLLDFSIIHL